MELGGTRQFVSKAARLSSRAAFCLRANDFADEESWAHLSHALTGVIITGEQEQKFPRNERAPFVFLCRKRETERSRSCGLGHL